MSIRFECVSCGKRLVVHDKLANRQLKCPHCSFPQTVPLRSSFEALPTKSSAEQEVSEDDLNEKELSFTNSSATLHAAAQVDSAESLGEAQQIPSAPGDRPKGKRHRRKGHSHEEEDLEWDITPMVDVAFLLLIFFMLTASFSIQKAIPTSAEEKEQPSRNSVQKERTDQPESFVIQIDEYNAYTVISGDGGTQDASSKQELIVVLQDLKTQLGEVSPRVIIQAHMLSTHGAVVACMDAAREAGFESFQMQSVDEFD